VQVVAGPPVDLSEFAGQPLSNRVLRAATDKIMTEVTALLGGLRGLTPPAEFYHPAVARRKLRQDLRTLQEASGASAAAAAGSNGAGPDLGTSPDLGAADAGRTDSAGEGPAAGTTGQ
jgi:hypothetical protein